MPSCVPTSYFSVEVCFRSEIPRKITKPFIFAWDSGDSPWQRAFSVPTPRVDDELSFPTDPRRTGSFPARIVAGDFGSNQRRWRRCRWRTAARPWRHRPSSCLRLPSKPRCRLQVPAPRRRSSRIRTSQRCPWRPRRAARPASKPRTAASPPTPRARSAGSPSSPSSAKERSAKSTWPAIRTSSATSP